TRVFAPRQTLAVALTGAGQGAWRPRPGGALVFLGGEVALAARLATRLRHTGFIYTEGYISHQERFAEVFVPTERARRRVLARGVPEEKVRLIGNLMVDAALAGGVPEPGAARRRLGLDAARPVVALLPGSRPFELRR